MLKDNKLINHNLDVKTLHFKFIYEKLIIKIH